MLCLCYFGSIDPARYGIRYTRLPGSMTPSDPDAPPMLELPTDAGFIVISATMLQGLYLSEADRTFYYPLQSRKPVEVLGEAIHGGRGRLRDVRGFWER